MSTLSKAAKDARAREFATVTGASTTEASRFLKATAWRLDAALDAFYSDPRSSSSAQTSASSSAALARNLEDVWAQYRDESNVDEIGMDGTMRYCADLAVDPEDVIMLALAWFTKAPTMGRFARSGWFEAWQTVRCDSLEQQRQYMETLRTRLTDPEGFKRIYVFAFDYAKAEGQKSLQFEIAQELWNLLIPLDPAASFPATHLASWIAFLTDRGGRAVSRDTWNLFLDFTRTTAADFSNYDEEGALNSSVYDIRRCLRTHEWQLSAAAWPSLIDDYVQSVLQR
ncbi:DCN1 family protein [Rhodotorula paludigena]|uniref:DCN1 family protein n=1 Tax=Rhodotorula paludigena TaxID=86838 RepID=UPI003180447E